MKNRRMCPYDTDALVSKLGHNSRAEKVVRSKIRTWSSFYGPLTCV